MSVPSSRIRPEVGCSNPAIRRSVVVFPHPDGPSSEKNSPLSTVRSMLSTATSVNRLVSATSWICPPGTGPPPSVLPGGRPPGPFESQLAGHEAHAQLEGALRAHRRIPERDLDGEPVQQGGQRYREVVGVHRAELPGHLTRQDHGTDRLTPALIELLPDTGYLGQPHRLGPQVEPDQPGAGGLIFEIHQEVHGDQFLDPPGRAGDAGHPAGASLVPGVLRVAERLGQQLVFGLEVVDDQSRAGPGARRDIRDPGLREAPLLDDRDRGAEHLLTALVGGVGDVAGAFTHADILAHSVTSRGLFTCPATSPSGALLLTLLRHSAGASHWPRPVT